MAQHWAIDFLQDVFPHYDTVVLWPDSRLTHKLRGPNETSGLARNPRRFVSSPTLKESKDDQALQVIQELGLARPKELEARGITRVHLARLVRQGRVGRLGRGIYAIAGHEPTAEHTLAHVAKLVPQGVLCLLTALRFHELTTQSPAEVWLALPEKARIPKLEYPRLRIARFSGLALTEGIDEHMVEGVPLRVYSPAKTVADCFKYRNKVGIDVAVEALRDFDRSHRGGATELAHFAEICRVSRVMQPYLDAIV
jgi:hypothetical protein